jgi:hypothetical protein
VRFVDFENASLVGAPQGADSVSNANMLLESTVPIAGCCSARVKSTDTTFVTVRLGSMAEAYIAFDIRLDAKPLHDTPIAVLANGPTAAQVTLTLMASGALTLKTTADIGTSSFTLNQGGEYRIGLHAGGAVLQAFAVAKGTKSYGTPFAQSTAVTFQPFDNLQLGTPTGTSQDLNLVFDNIAIDTSQLPPL